MSSPLAYRLRNLTDTLAHGRPDPTAGDADWCYACNAVTRWDDDVCRGCRREWGHEPTPRRARLTAQQRRRRVLEAIKLAAALAALSAVVTAAFWTASDILAERDADPGFTFPACVTEDDPGPCYWDAEHRGNGQGRSFIVVDDVVTYLPAEGR